MSNLTQEEKDSILANINIDMVGEKEMEGLQFNIQSQYENIITQMYKDVFKSESISIGMGGSSDEYSFKHMMIPSVTITQKEISKSFAIDNDYSLLDIDELKYTIRKISEFILKFDLNTYDELLKEQNKIKNDVEIFTLYNIENATIYDYKLVENYYTLIEPNGYTSAYNIVFKIMKA